MAEFLSQEEIEALLDISDEQEPILKRYKLFSFSHSFLNDIQKGIQSVKSLNQMFLRYNNNEILTLWSENNQDIVFKKGGVSDDLEHIIKLFNVKENKYPYSCSFESNYNLNNCLTNVSIILDERIYDSVEKLKRKEVFFLNNDLFELNSDGSISSKKLFKEPFNDFEKDLILFLTTQDDLN